MVMIGEILPQEFSDDITGIVFSRRTKNGNRISVWNKTFEANFVERLGCVDAFSLSLFLRSQ